MSGSYFTKKLECILQGLVSCKSFPAFGPLSGDKNPFLLDKKGGDLTYLLFLSRAILFKISLMSKWSIPG